MHLKSLLSLAFILVFSAGVTAQGILPNFGSSRSGTAGYQFTKISVDPRAAAMGNSSIADTYDGAALYWNPALAARADRSQFYASHTAYFVDISMNYIAYIHRFRGFSLGASLQYLDSGDINETTEFNPTGTGRTFKTVHLSAGLTIAQNLTELFSYGLTLRYLDERIEEISIPTAAVDFGFFYQVGDTGLRFAVGINNFGFDASPSGTTSRTTLDGVVEESDFEEVPLPTTFNLGAAFDAYERDNHRIIVTAQVSNPSDNSERLSIGSEYSFMEQFHVRAGYQFGQDEFSIPSFGVGFDLPFGPRSVGFDYGFTTFDRLGSIHRLAMKITL